MLLFLASFLWLGLRAATRAPDRFGGLLALGLVAWVAAETLINVGAVVGVLPVTGIPLPFISFGGSSLVITMAAAGVLINVARQGEAMGSRSGRVGRHGAGAGSSGREATRWERIRRKGSWEASAGGAGRGR